MPKKIDRTPVTVGQVYRDKYFGRLRNGRTIRITDVTENGVSADVLTDVRGEPVGGRKTAMTLKTLLSGYELVKEQK